MLTRLRLKNFKSWVDTGDITLKPITGIFGANSSGKTSLLQALLLLKQTAESSDRSQPLQFGNNSGIVDLGDFLSAVYRHDPVVDIMLSMGWERPTGLVGLDLQLPGNGWLNSRNLEFGATVGVPTKSALGAQTAVREMHYGVGKQLFGLRLQPDQLKQYELFAESEIVSFIRVPHKDLLLPGPNKCYGFPDEARALYTNAGFLPDLELFLEQELKSVSYLGPIRAYLERLYTWTGAEPPDVGRDGSQAIHALLASRDWGNPARRGQGPLPTTVEAEVAEWLKNLGMVAEFRVQPVTKGSQIFQVLVRQIEGGSETLITDVGFGVSQILPVIVLCFYAPAGSTVILEQPEIHLHPAVQSNLADVLIDACHRRGIQIIVESHSEHLLRRLQRRIAEQTLKSEDIALYFCESGPHGSTLRSLELDEYGQIKNWPRDFFGDEFGEIADTQEAVLKRKLQDVA